MSFLKVPLVGALLKGHQTEIITFGTSLDFARFGPTGIRRPSAAPRLRPSPWRSVSPSLCLSVCVCVSVCARKDGFSRL